MLFRIIIRWESEVYNVHPVTPNTMWVRASSMKFALSKKLYGGVQCKGQFH
jgi:hypothetical protein